MEKEHIDIRMRCVELAERLHARSQNSNPNDILATSDQIYYHVITGSSPTQESAGEDDILKDVAPPATKSKKGNRS